MDSLFVGRYSESGLTALSIIYPIQLLMIALAAHESGLDQEFISDVHKNSPDILRELYLSTRVVQDAIEAQEKIIRKIADNGSCVIVGRSADYVLKDYDNVVNIFVCGDMESKIHRMMWTFSLEKEVAEERIRETDKQRHKYYNYYTGKTWDTASNYDLCLNTGDMTIEEAAEQIKLYLKQKGLMK